MKKCLYCGSELPDSCVVDFCEKCGKSVWGEKMFNAIVQNMEEARERGDLFQACSFKEFSKEVGKSEGFGL